MPELDAVRAEYEPLGLGFLAVSLDPDAAAAEAVAAEEKLGIRIAVSEGGEMLGPLCVRAVPSTVFVDDRGIIAAAASGPRQRSFFERRARELVGR